MKPQQLDMLRILAYELDTPDIRDSYERASQVRGPWRESRHLLPNEEEIDDERLN